MKIKTYVHKKPVSNGTVTTISSESAFVRIDRIRKEGKRYACRLTNPEEDAPYNEHHTNFLWLYFSKSENKELKVPVLKQGQELIV